jgi:hypothetical protein
MGERRPLVAGLKSPDPRAEKEFVYARKVADAPAETVPDAAPEEAREGKGRASAGRLPLTTRVPADYAAALKRASLERQLSGQTPNTLQDILEEALEPWLRTHGYVK